MKKSTTKKVIYTTIAFAGGFMLYKLVKRAIEMRMKIPNPEGTMPAVEGTLSSTPISGSSDTILDNLDEDGANVILLGSTTMHQSHAYLSNALEVPVINPGPLTYKMIETLLGLGLSHSSVAYPKSPVPRDAMLHAMLKTAEEFEH